MVFKGDLLFSHGLSRFPCRALGACLPNTGWGTSTFTSWPARGNTTSAWSWRTGTDTRPSPSTTASRSAVRNRTTGKTELWSHLRTKRMVIRNKQTSFSLTRSGSAEFKGDFILIRRSSKRELRMKCYYLHLNPTITEGRSSWLEWH